MDVLTDFVATLDPGGDGNCRMRLMKHLANQRTKAASKLLRKVQANAKEVRADLKQCGKMAEAGLNSANARNAKKKDKQKNRQKSADSISSALQIEQELNDWPKLSQNNIHPFRLKVKELRYILELAESSDSKVLDALGEVKDQVGLWHDWHELSGIAAEVLDHGTACPITTQIRTRTKHEFEKAMNSANRLRNDYLTSESRRPARRKGADKEIHPDMIKASARLAS